MKKLAFFILAIIFMQAYVYSEVVTYSEGGKFGLKEKQGSTITDAKYKKLIKLGETAWIMQSGIKFGIIRDDGSIIIKPTYNQAERVLGKFVKFRKGDKYGIFDEMGFEILPVEYSSIDLLYGGKFVTCKNYKYGMADLNGMIILDNIFDDIYMPDFNTLVILYGLDTYQIQRDEGKTLTVPYDLQSIHDTASVKISKLKTNPFTSTGYYGLEATNYVLKLFSSISPAYEETIDELMFSQGADTVSVFVKMSWLPKFPFVYAKRYFKNLASPNNGPLGEIRDNLKYKLYEESPYLDASD